MVRKIAIVLMAVLLSAVSWAGDVGQERIKWGELEARIRGRKVALVLPDGTHLQGKVIAVEPDGLRLNVKGKPLVPRRSVSLLRVTEYRKLGRIIGTVGAAAAAGGIAAAAYPDIYEGTVIIVVPAVVAAGVAGSAIGGYYIGKKFDKRVTEITIVPDNP